VELEAQTAGEPRQGRQGRLVVTGLEPSDGRLLHTELASQRGLRQPVVDPVLDDAEGDGMGERGALVLCPNLWVLQVLGVKAGLAAVRMGAGERTGCLWRLVSAGAPPPASSGAVRPAGDAPPPSPAAPRRFAPRRSGGARDRRRRAPLRPACRPGAAPSERRSAALWCASSPSAGGWGRAQVGVSHSITRATRLSIQLR